jgi:hypothetical protein
MVGSSPQQDAAVLWGVEIASGVAGALIGWRVSRSTTGAALGLIAGLLAPPVVVTIRYRVFPPATPHGGRLP